MKKLLSAIVLAVGANIARKIIAQKNKNKPIVFVSHRIEGLEEIEAFESQRIRRQTYTWKRFLKDKPLAGAVLGFFALSILGIPFVNQYSYLFKASLIGLKPIEFTGTVSPIEKVPNWVELSDAERRMTYAELSSSKFIALPDYNLGEMQSGKTYDRHHEDERNTYITYPVPNLGNYKLDGTENSGSHTGVDIKAPIGTPVRAVANGEVYKTGNQTTGFGKHIVIAHVGIPDPENPNQKTTLLSAYAHLSSISVREGQKVTKGQVIGKVGDSGMATAPHLHFQIDKSDAPFFPYWPFTWDDVKNAGLNSYFDAVKNGIGKSNGLRYTVHPMRFVSNFQNYVGPEKLVASTVTPAPQPAQNPSTEIPAESNDEPEEGISEQEEEPENTPRQKTYSRTNTQNSQNISENDVEFQTDRIYIPGKEKIVQLRVDPKMLVALGTVEVDSTLEYLADIEPKILTKNDFSGDTAQVKVRTDSNRTFKLIARGSFGEVKSKSLRAQVFTDVPVTHKYANSIKYLTEEDIVKGYPDGSFKPNDTLNRAEAVKILLEGNNISVAKALPNFFGDVPRSAWYADYVGTAVKNNIVKGYADGEFKPGNQISRAEFLKVAILTAGFAPAEELSYEPYPDVPRDAWFAPYFDFAKTNDLIELQRGGYAVPSQPIGRGEAADIIYKLSRLK
ncbi:S-layer homology domain-containing protein [Candidatus Gracilibacteria bacterium]|nr:S-layer homology domain-containing protein [Candidatus Gracilibacteria bacterium]MCF7819625.1 S-layer homology domain-containing protein [Candidatus Gracilibacteria bacterium]